ncbi:MAG: Hydroxymethylpyrimidine ABC transporter, transmembrane component [Burkholderiaceae bacterium]|jgi:NitT/TauT family transport system permease protein|nr:MAG: Hydroxymethylpyrimidine ABC transporter, transmembrane component [Burkholderiaceae bacterium]
MSTEQSMTFDALRDHEQPATGPERRAAAAPPVRESRVLGLPRALWPKILAPVLTGLALLGLWEFSVRAAGIPPYILPAPSGIAHALVANWSSLVGSMWITLSISLAALALAIVVGLALSILFTQSKWMELAFFPYAVVMQVTPVVAIAPLIIIWANNVVVSLLVCAWLVAFFPILSNTTLGLNSADHNLVNLFQLYRATRWQTLRYLRLPAAAPYFLGGVRISGGLSLIGAVVAEFVAGTGGVASGLASRILESGYQLQIPRMFAALFLVSMCGVVIFVCLSLVSHLALRKWHDSALKREN